MYSSQSGRKLKNSIESRVVKQRNYHNDLRLYSKQASCESYVIGVYIWKNNNKDISDLVD